MKKILLAVVVCFSAGLAYSQTYVVIVNKSNSASSINKKELSDIFLKKTKSFSNGQSSLPVDLKGNNPVRKSFSSDVHGKSVAAVKSFWQQSVFQGKATPPVEKSSDQDIITYVSKNPGAIGYVSREANISIVKRVSVN